jgi:hypothetical protein
VHIIAHIQGGKIHLSFMPYKIFWDMPNNRRGSLRQIPENLTLSILLEILTYGNQRFVKDLFLSLLEFFWNLNDRIDLNTFDEDLVWTEIRQVPS